MSNDIAKVASAPLPEAVERVLIDGDLSKLSPQDRLRFYVSRCEAAGIDPRCRPFEYITLQGKLTLYAKKECAEQLNGLHGISHKITAISQDKETGLVEVMIDAFTRGGRQTSDIGVVNAKGLVGEQLANARMKAVTKAKRRATLSLCGLGDVIDESELDTVKYQPCSPTGTPVPISNGTGHGSGKYASEEDAKNYLASIGFYIDKRNQQWLDRWTQADGQIPDKLTPHLCTLKGADDHLTEYAEQCGMIAPGSRPENGIKPSQVGRLAAIPYTKSNQDQVKLKRELKSFLDRQEAIAVEKLKADHPELFEPEETPEAADEWEEGRE